MYLEKAYVSVVHKKRAYTLDKSPCGKLSTGFCLILIKLFALAVHRSSRERLEKNPDRPASGIGHSSSMHFLVGRVSFFQLFGKEGLLVFCRQLILDQLIRDERENFYLLLPSRVHRQAIGFLHRMSGVFV